MAVAHTTVKCAKATERRSAEDLAENTAEDMMEDTAEATVSAVSTVIVVNAASVQITAQRTVHQD